MGQANNIVKEAYEENLIKSVLNSIEQHGGRKCLSSIILTGSFGRGESTYEIDTDEQFHLKSDVEIALIFPDSSKKNIVEKLIREVSAEFEEDLNLMAVNEKRVRKVYNFNFSIRIPKYKTIFMYDLFNGSRTIWGQDFIKSKEVRLSDVDPYEAKRLVANRIGELVYLQTHTDDVEKKEYLRKQWKGKLVLAIVSAWLICEGEYVSSYYGQYQRMKNKIADVEGTLGEEFFEEYDMVFRFLRENGPVYEIPDKKLIGYVQRIDQYFRKKGVGKSKVNSSSRVMKYVFKYAKTGMKYGIVGFENEILQALISHFWKKSDMAIKDADVWHRVLY